MEKVFFTLAFVLFFLIEYGVDHRGLNEKNETFINVRRYDKDTTDNDTLQPYCAKAVRDFYYSYVSCVRIDRQFSFIRRVRILIARVAHLSLSMEGRCSRDSIVDDSCFINSSYIQGVSKYVKQLTKVFQIVRDTYRS